MLSESVSAADPEGEAQASVKPQTKNRIDKYAMTPHFTSLHPASRGIEPISLLGG